MTFELLETDTAADDARVAPHKWPAIIAYVVLILAIPIGFAVGGTTSSFANAGLSYAPFVVLAVLAYLGVTHNSAKVLTIMWLILLLLGGAAVAMGFSALASGQLGLDPGNVPADGLNATAQIVSRVGLGVLIALVLGFLCFIPALRRGLSYLLPIDPTAFVHTAALVAVIAFTIMMAAPLIVLGEPPLLSPAIMDTLPEEAFDETNGLLSTLYTLIWSIPLAILARRKKWIAI